MKADNDLNFQEVFEEMTDLQNIENQKAKEV